MKAPHRLPGPSRTLAERARGAHLILVGLPGAGKTTLGQLVADRLGSPFVDLDRLIEAAERRSIGEIFASDGEAHFRALERQATEYMVGADNSVLAPGGGWVTQPGLLARLRPPGRIIHLEVSPEAAVARMGNDIAARPLLSVSDPVAVVRGLAESRGAAYATADAALNTESLDLQALVEQIATLAVAWDVGVG